MPVDRRVQPGDVVVGSFELGRKIRSGTILVGEPLAEVGESSRDPSRSKSLFVVTHADWHGEGQKRTWRAYASRLRPDESFDEGAEIIMFQQGGNVPFRANVWISGRFIEEDPPVENAPSWDPESEYELPSPGVSAQGEARPTRKMPPRQGASIKPGAVVLVCTICSFRQDPPEGVDPVQLRNMPCPICSETNVSDKPMVIRKMEV